MVGIFFYSNSFFFSFSSRNVDLVHNNPNSHNLQYRLEVQAIKKGNHIHTFVRDNFDIYIQLKSKVLSILASHSLYFEEILLYA